MFDSNWWWIIVDDKRIVGGLVLSRLKLLQRQVKIISKEENNYVHFVLYYLPQHLGCIEQFCAAFKLNILKLTENILQIVQILLGNEVRAMAQFSWLRWHQEGWNIPSWNLYCFLFSGITPKLKKENIKSLLLDSLKVRVILHICFSCWEGIDQFWFLLKIKSHPLQKQINNSISWRFQGFWIFWDLF